MEKTGNTAKKVYDFNTAGVLEVLIKDTWYRVTANHFRSFDSERRITEPIKQPGVTESKVKVPTITYTYEGPLYVLGTNMEVPRRDSQVLVENPTTVSHNSLQHSSRI